MTIEEEKNDRRGWPESEEPLSKPNSMEETPEKFELITEQQAFENKIVGVIKNLVHRSLQWEDGEIKGWDEQMITSLAPILLKPFFADLLAKVSEQEKEIERLREERKELLEGIRIRVDFMPEQLQKFFHALLNKFNDSKQ